MKSEHDTIHIVCPHCGRDWGYFVFAVMVFVSRLRCRCGASLEPHLDAHGDDHRMELLKVSQPPCGCCMGEGSFNWKHRLEDGSTATRTYLCDCGAGQRLDREAREKVKDLAAEYAESFAVRRAETHKPISDAEHARIRDRQERIGLRRLPPFWRNMAGGQPPTQDEQMANWRTGAPRQPQPTEVDFIARDDYGPIEQGDLE